MSSIFVQIAAYHDYELPRTIKDCIEKSSKNNIINIGVNFTFWSRKKEFIFPEYDNVKINIMKSPEGLGVGVGRYNANKFYNNEDYYLQIDSHTRFVENWDENFISTHQKYTSQGYNPILTTYPGWYKYVDYNIVYEENPTVPFIDFKHDEKLFLHAGYLNQDGNPNKPENIFTNSVAGGQIFGAGNISEIPLNPKIFMWGEEFLTAARFFTHGYDLMLPEQQNLYHLYFGDPVSSQRRQPTLDYPKQTEALIRESNDEIRTIIHNKIIGPDALGSKRTLDEFFKYAGIDFN